MIRIILFLVICILNPLFAKDNIFQNHILEIGIGWENMGLSPQTTWKPYLYSQGSRKEMSLTLGWRNLGEDKIYYSTYGRLHYGWDWSLSGAMNLLEFQVGLLGFGVYMSKPLAAYSQQERIGKWFSTFEINFASIAIGGNLSPKSGSGQREWSDTDNQFGNQYYAFGHSYAYFHYSIPLRMQFWKEMNKLGAGMFFEAESLIIEKSLNRSMPIAIGYNVMTGVILKFK
ncbi:MAG: hypothetical protein ACRCS8_01625 [Brevinema sp.]